ncbi:MAG TPA: hypothetical protein VFF26_01420 [Gallionella sp.]|nr:hypothetical protein [Gallionella sp.]
MPFSSRDIANPQFNFENFGIRLASRTSHFTGDTLATPQEVRGEGGIWADLAEENFSLVGDSLFTIDTAETKAGLLPGIASTLHIELSFPNRESTLTPEKNYVVLILDNERISLVDWAVATSPDLNVFTGQDAPALYFEIPLIPTSREPSQISLTEDMPEQRALLRDRINQWEKNSQLTFGVFCFEDEDILFRFHPAFPMRYAYLHYPRARFAAFDLVDFIAKKADRYLKHNTGGKEQLQVILPDGTTREATPQDLQQMQNKKALLLCHGILSSTEGAFKGILSDPEFMEPLHQRYDGNILAWDHYTLSKTTALNAADLLAGMPALRDVKGLDILCHSRGAGVIRNLLENPNNQSIFSQQKITVGKSVFVAGACLGSQLADAKNTNRLFRRLNMLFWFSGGTPKGFIRAILTILKLLATLAQKMPGVEAMDPTGQEVATLNGYGTTSAAEYQYIMANYDFRFLPAKLLEEFLWDDGVFDGQGNDLVVPYEGASANNKYLPGFGAKQNALSYDNSGKAQSIVMHTNFFDQGQTKQVLGALLP